MKVKHDKKKRYSLLDTIRGMVLVSMVIYHAVWNCVYIYGKEWSWYQSKGAYIWQQSICQTFILLSGFCFCLGRNPWKNGLRVFGSGLIVTTVTCLVMPQNRVVFGVLTCIGSCILFVALGEKFLEKIPALTGSVGSMGLFFLTKNINEGFLGSRTQKIFEIPAVWYQNYVTTYLGFPFRGFYSTDYFSLFPWLFLFLAGFYLYHVCESRGWLEKDILREGTPLFSFFGRHSLGIYLIHQPIIFALQEILLK